MMRKVSSLIAGLTVGSKHSSHYAWTRTRRKHRVWDNTEFTWLPAASVGWRWSLPTTLRRQHARASRWLGAHRCHRAQSGTNRSRPSRNQMRRAARSSVCARSKRSELKFWSSAQTSPTRSNLARRSQKCASVLVQSTAWFTRPVFPAAAWSN